MSLKLPPKSAGLKSEDLDVLFERLHRRQTRDKDAIRERIFTAFMRYAHKQALLIFRDETLLTHDESTSVAFDALWKAVNDFDPSYGVKFATYAAKIIQRDLRVARRRALINQGRTLSLEKHFTMPDNQEDEQPYPPEMLRDPWDDIDEATSYQEAIRFLLSLRLKDWHRVLIQDYLKYDGNLAEIGRNAKDEKGKPHPVCRERVRQVFEILKQEVREKLEETGLKLDLDLIPKL